MGPFVMPKVFPSIFVSCGKEDNSVIGHTPGTEGGTEGGKPDKRQNKHWTQRPSQLSTRLLTTQQGCPSLYLVVMGMQIVWNNCTPNKSEKVLLMELLNIDLLICMFEAGTSLY